MADDLFFTLTPSLAMSVVEKLGPRSTGFCFQLNSYENRVFELELEGGTRVVAKFYRPGRWSREQILDEHKFILELEHQDIPVGAPMPLSGTDTVVEVDGLFCAVFKKVRGRSPEDMKAPDLERIGRLIARMHNAGEWKPALHRRKLTVEEFGDKSLETLLELGFIPKALEEAYVAVAEDIFDWLDPKLSRMKTLRVHGDLHRGNLLENKEGYWLVDFDDMVNGPAVQDLWLLVPGRDEASLEERDALIKGYASMRKFDRDELMIVEGLRALRVVHYSAWIARRYHDPAFLRVFDQFKENRYWDEELNQLREIRARLS
ncbi:MAG: serine/threonine protein kinase [Deltaproteobacteria bacterium]|nr:serine/threonine protein kinase [Deltaproteobacteria bacterium]